MSTRRRYLAPWSRKAVELNEARNLLGIQSKAAMEKCLAGLRGKPAVYHCVSRVVDRRQVLGAEEKEKFVYYMRIYEEFCMVRVLTHCVMGNHFHILVEIPEAPEDRGKSWSDDQFLKHLSCLYYGPRYTAIAAELTRLREQKLDADAEALRDRFFARMWDLSSFMKTLKQRFTQWFNRVNDRDGYLWSDRFKSVLVESGRAARVVAAYIDLNPVRAGMVKDPKDYRWSGYGEAVAGVRRAREGLRLVVFGQVADHLGESLAARAQEASGSWREVAAEYRRSLYMDGEESERDERSNRAGIPAGRVEAVLAKGGRLSEAEMMRCRVRYFTDGMAVGGEGFLEQVFTMSRGCFPASRKTGPRRMRRVETPLRTLRDLRKEAIGN